MYLFFIGAVDFEAGNNHYKGHHKGWNRARVQFICQLRAKPLREQLFELKNEDTINLRLSNHKSENRIRVKYGC